MFYALGRGVPEAGLTFAAAMAVGVLATLASVALVTILARGWAVRLMERFGASAQTLGRVLDAVAGCLVIMLAGRELWA